MSSHWLPLLLCALLVTLSYGDISLNEIDIDGAMQKTKEIVQPKKVGNSGAIEERGRLINSLLNGYDKRNYPTNMTIKFGVALLSFDLVEDKDTLETAAWLRMQWNDPRLHWNKKDFDVDVLRLLPDQVWHPDITLYNSVSLPMMTKCWDSNVVVFANGDVLWVPPCLLSSHCAHNLKKDPFGPQTCSMKFGSWTFDENSMGLEFYNNTEKADVDYLRESTHWDLISNEATKEIKYYACCAEPYSAVIYNITVQRKESPKTCSL